MINKNNKKSRKSFKFKKINMSSKTKSILVTVVIIALIFLLLMGIRALMNQKKNNVEEGYEFVDVKWKSGGISLENGSMISDSKYMYSSEISVDTVFKINAEFGSNVSYMVFYYDDVGELLYVDNKTEGEKVVGYTSDYRKDISEISLEEGKTIDHVRVCVEWLSNDDEKLNYFERINLARQIDVIVAEESVEEE